MKRSATLLLCTAIMGLGMCSPESYAHDWYTGLKNKRNEMCCSIHDFKPVKAWIDETDGLWHAIYPYADGRTQEFAIPEDIILPDELNKEPFQAHLAVLYGKPRCFLRKSTGG